MNNTAFSKYRRLLTALATRVRADAATMTERVRTPSGGNGGSELSNAPLHLGDMGTEEYLYDMNVTLLANEQHIASQIRAALARLDKGTFGVCEACAHPIGT